ncbi:MAG TPA: hypothetical protein VJY41_07880 [Prolixibacteraceae bacterium]|nr:hypothetical protein [Prolixibacteraceae bacterium]
MQLIKTAATFLFVFWVSGLSAQYYKVVCDLKARSSIAVDKKLFNRFHTFGEIELAMEQDISRIGKI